jgi:hypothetical protein
MRRALAFALLVFAYASGAAGQSRESTPVVLRLPGSTRAMALGNAFVLGSRDPDAVFYNPAAVATTGGAGVAVQRYGSASTLANLSAGRGWSSGGLAIGLQVLTYGASSDGFAGLPTTEAGLLNTGTVGASDIVVTGVYARTIGGFDFGLGAKYIDQRIGGGRDATAALDLGILKELGPVTLGLVGRNLGLDLEIEGTALRLPRDLTLGASTSSQQVGPLDILATAAITRWSGGDIIPAGGVEISFWPIQGRTFTGRIGLQRIPGGDQSPFSFGLGFTGDNITVEYAFQPYESPGAAHRFGLRWR